MIEVVFTRLVSGEWVVEGNTPRAIALILDRRAFLLDDEGRMVVPRFDVEDFAAELEAAGVSVHV